MNQIHDVPIGTKTELGKGAYRIGTPVSSPSTRQTIAARIEDLANQAAVVSRELAEAREEYQRAVLMREQATKRFISITEALLQAIHEHREGAPENVPYQP